MRYCRMHECSVGDVLAHPLIAANGSILLRANVPLTSYAIKRATVMGFKGVYIFDDLSEDILVNSTLPLDVQVRVMQGLNEFSIDNYIYLADEIASSIASDALAITDLSALQRFDDITYRHSLNVATYCATVGLYLGYDTEKLRNITMAGLLHDIGKMEIPYEIVNKNGPLSEEERQLMCEHPRIGYELLRENKNIPSVVRVSVLEHHENVDGTGYPRGIIGRDIYEFAKIIHIVDVYDAMISKRSYKEEIPPNFVVQFLQEKCDIMFDSHYCDIFIRNLVLYPAGMLVRLSNDEICLVVSTTKGYPTRPFVRSLSTGENIDLSEVKDLDIVDYVF